MSYGQTDEIVEWREYAHTLHKRLTVSLCMNLALLVALFFLELQR